MTKHMLNDHGAFFDQYREQHLGERGARYPLSYLLLTWTVAMVPLIALTAALNASEPTSVAVGAALWIAFGLFFWFTTVLEALIAHGVLYLLGARGLTATLEAYAFPSTIRYGLWWVPVVNIALGLYGLYQQIVGAERFHDVSRGGAAVALVLAALIAVPLSIAALVVAVAVVGTFVIGLGGGSGPV